MARGQGPSVLDDPFVLIEDHTIVGSVDRGLNSTNHMPEEGGSRNR